MEATCVSCDGSAEVNQITKVVPLFGEALFSTTSCSHCNYHSSDVLFLEEHPAKRFTKKVSSVKDLETKLVRSATTFIELPELGIEITPKGFSDGFYTNLEGLLERILSNTEHYLKQQKAEHVIKKLKQAKEGTVPFTIIISDPFGNCALIGDHVEEKTLTEEEVAAFEKEINA